MTTRRAALALAAAVLSSARPVTAGHALFDVAEHQLLEATEADVVIAPGRAADLLLVAVLRERIASGEVALTDRVTVLPVADDRGPPISTLEPVEIGELLQLLLLTDSRTAAKTLAWAVGPSIGRALTRMQQMMGRLGLKRTTIANDWPFAAGLTTPRAVGQRGATTVRELGELALVIANDPDMRRRLSRDGVPISNGSLIVRATSPLIEAATASAMTAGPIPSGARIALVEHENLALIAVTTGGRVDEDLASILQRAFRRYRRVELVREGQAIGARIRVRSGIIPSFNAVAAEPWGITAQQNSPLSLAFRLQLPKEIDAPVEVHQRMGELIVEREGRVLAVVPLVSPLAIAPSGWLDTAQRSNTR